MNNLPSLSKIKQEKLELLSLIQERERRISFDPLLYARQHPKQLEATKSDKAIRALFWGNRVGKTEWGAQEVDRYVLNQHPFRQIDLPIEVWCACPSFDQQKETTQKKLEVYIPKHRIKHITYVKNGVWGEVLLDDSTRINFKSYEQGREKFQGAGKRLIWFDEEPPYDIWEECFVRSEAGIPLDILLTMTAVKGMTWVYDRIYMDTNNPDLFISEAGWDDNPWLTESQKRQMARGLTPEALKVRREGRFVKKVGLVCSWWSRGIHLKNTEYNPNWETTISIDFGFSNPSAILFNGADYDDNISIYDGWYGSQNTTPMLAKKIDEICEKYELKSKDVPIIADSAQANDIQQMADLGYSIIGIKKQSGSNNENWDEYRASKMYEYGETKDGRSKITVSNELTWINPKTGNSENWFLKEVENLMWNERKTNAGEYESGARWSPDCANHAIDSFSYYLVDHIDQPELPKVKKPWEGKIPTTYVPPSVVEEDDNQWGEGDMIEI